MNRILALQGMSMTSAAEENPASGQSNNCSSATTACSTQSSFCTGQQANMAW